MGLTLLGGVGAVLRFLVDGAVSRRVARGFPYGTLVVNISGAAGLGLLDGLGLSRDATFLVGTGVFGAYTTFSTWVFETQRLAEERQMARAAGNVGISVLLGLAAAALGLWIGGRL
jgi:CrcB protein